MTCAEPVVQEALKANLLQRTRELRTERTKSQDLGAEVLTLVNRVAVLEEQARNSGCMPLSSAAMTESKHGEEWAHAPSSKTAAALAATAEFNAAAASGDVIALRKQLQDLTADLDAARKEVQAVKADWKRDVQSHRDSLLRVIPEDVVDSCGPAIDELVSTHQALEERLHAQWHRTQADLDTARARNRALVQRCSHLRKRVAALSKDAVEVAAIEAADGETDLALPVCARAVGHALRERKEGGQYSPARAWLY